MTVYLSFSFVDQLKSAFLLSSFTRAIRYISSNFKFIIGKASYVINVSSV